MTVLMAVLLVGVFVGLTAALAHADDDTGGGA